MAPETIRRGGEEGQILGVRGQCAGVGANIREEIVPAQESTSSDAFLSSRVILSPLQTVNPILWIALFVCLETYLLITKKITDS